MNGLEIVFIGWLAGMLTIASIYFIGWIIKVFREILDCGKLF